MDSSSSSKWHGSASKAVQVSPQKLWEIASDFAGLHKWIPGIRKCHLIEGNDPRTPSCVRYIEGSTKSFEASGKCKSWAKEKLLTMDSKKRIFSYAVVESNLGLEGYSATLSVCEGDAAGSSIVNWSFEMNPMLGKSKETVVGSMVSVLSSYIDLFAAAVV